MSAFIGQSTTTARDDEASKATSIGISSGMPPPRTAGSARGGGWSDGGGDGGEGAGEDSTGGAGRTFAEGSVRACGAGLPAQAPTASNAASAA
jgi:hypothetical protein